jgi:hypothetical protein
MSLQRFREAMARHLGQELTPAIAAAIEAEAFTAPDLSIDPARFTAQAYGDYTIQAEGFRSILDELTPLHEAHWCETEGYRHGLALNPNYPNLFARERAGRLIQFTVRKGPELCGHLRMFLFESEHTQTPVAAEDALYLKPEHRGSFLVMALLRYVEAALRQFGPLEIRANSKAANRADVLMRRMGYQLAAYQFVKFIGGDPC